MTLRQLADKTLNGSKVAVAIVVACTTLLGGFGSCAFQSVKGDLADHTRTAKETHKDLRLADKEHEREIHKLDVRIERAEGAVADLETLAALLQAMKDETVAQNYSHRLTTALMVQGINQLLRRQGLDPIEVPRSANLPEVGSD